MTYPDVGSRGPSVAAGDTDTSDAPAGAPSVESGGISVPRAVFHTGAGYVAHSDMTGASTNAPATHDTDGDDGLPDIPRYEGPAVSDADNALPAPMVNPSAGNQGPQESGMTDINPQGVAPHPGTVGPVSDRVVFPDTTQGNPH